MFRKYIKIKQFCAKVPFKQCQTRFIIKKRHKQETIHSEVSFYPKSITISSQQILQITYVQKSIKQFGLYLIAFSYLNRVVNLGYIELDLSINFQERKYSLKGIHQQNGYIILSIYDEEIKNRMQIQRKKRQQVKKQYKTNTRNREINYSYESKQTYMKTKEKNRQIQIQPFKNIDFDKKQEKSCIQSIIIERSLYTDEKSSKSKQQQNMNKDNKSVEDDVIQISRKEDDVNEKINKNYETPKHKQSIEKENFQVSQKENKNEILENQKKIDNIDQSLNKNFDIPINQQSIENQILKASQQQDKVIEALNNNKEIPKNQLSIEKYDLKCSKQQDKFDQKANQSQEIPKHQSSISNYVFEISQKEDKVDQKANKNQEIINRQQSVQNEILENVQQIKKLDEKLIINQEIPRHYQSIQKRILDFPQKEDQSNENINKSYDIQNKCSQVTILEPIIVPNKQQIKKNQQTDIFESQLLLHKQKDKKLLQQINRDRLNRLQKYKFIKKSLLLRSK